MKIKWTRRKLNQRILIINNQLLIINCQRDDMGTAEDRGFFLRDVAAMGDDAPGGMGKTLV
jgi:hypothetical protein